MKPTLFSPLQIGALQLKNRIIMAPMTRARAEPGHVAGALMAEHYAQRASAGLLIAEATMVSADASAFVNEPGIFGPAQVEGYRRVVDAVHAAGGLIALQLWHPGRAAHSVLNGGVQPVSSTDRAIAGEIATPQGMLPYEAPRRLRRDEIPGVIADFRRGFENAKTAGFDAVEVHGAHGYLLDQFLRDSVNDRQDDYGGPLVNRARLLLEVIDEAIAVFGAARVGLRISPLVAFNDIQDSDPKTLTRYIAEQIQQRHLAFFELRHERHDLPAEIELAQIARRYYRGTLILNGGFDLASGNAALAQGGADAIAYAKPFIANPDLVTRFAQQAPLAAPDFDLLYTPGARGYNDYPVLAAERGETALPA